jgi:hypothetical protein
MIIEKQRYRGLFDWSRFPVGDNRELVYSPLTRSTHNLTAMQVRILRECRAFETLENHAAQLCTVLKLPADRVSAVRHQLVDLAHAGLLVSHEGLTSHCTRYSVIEAIPPKISSVGFPTRNRPEELKRCLESYAECAKLYGHDDLKFVVVDQSDETGTQQANLQVLEIIKAQFGIDSHYLNRGDAEVFARQLCQHADVSPDIVNFALLNVENLPLTVGLSRNLMQLRTIGDLTLEADDDTICRVTPCLELRPGLSLSSEYDPTEFWFLSQSEVESLGNGFITEDVIALHEQLLGKAVSQCIQDASPSSLNLEQITSGFVRRMEPSGGRVAFTSIGVAGESGMGGSHYLLFLEQKSRERLMESESQYRFALTNHQVMRSVTSNTIGSGCLIPGHNLGFDNRQLLPPFFPVLRGQDLTFGELLCLMPEGGFIGYLPWHILHKPILQRTYPPEHLRKRVSRLRSADIFRMLVNLFTAGRERTPKRDFAALGQSLVEWGSAPLADFEEMLRLSLSRRASLDLIRMEGLLKRYDEKPNFWAADMYMAMSAIRETLPETIYIAGSDLVDLFGLEAARIIQQRLVRRYGELLLSWSSIRQAAHEIRYRGLTRDQ